MQFYSLLRNKDTGSGQCQSWPLGVVWRWCLEDESLSNLQWVSFETSLENLQGLLLCRFLSCGMSFPWRMSCSSSTPVLLKKVSRSPSAPPRKLIEPQRWTFTCYEARVVWTMESSEVNYKRDFELGAWHQPWPSWLCGWQQRGEYVGRLLTPHRDFHRKPVTVAVRQTQVPLPAPCYTTCLCTCYVGDLCTQRTWRRCGNFVSRGKEIRRGLLHRCQALGTLWGAVCPCTQSYCCFPVKHCSLLQETIGLLPVVR